MVRKVWVVAVVLAGGMMGRAARVVGQEAGALLVGGSARGVFAPVKEWTGRWIAAEGKEGPLPLFRRGFTVKAKPVEAVLYVSGLGQYEARVNGRAVTADKLTPGWTDYRKRVLYDVYDVLPLVRAGENALGVMLGNGMYNVLETPGRYTKFSGTFGEPKLIAELHLRYADGTREVVGTDARWKVHPGPITFSGVYGGEDFDARLEPRGWDVAGFDEGSWRAAKEVDGPGGVLERETAPPIRVAETVAAVGVTHPAAGIAVYDLGKNMAGWPTLRVSGPAGGKVRLLGGELLDAKGRVSQESAHAFAGDPNLFSYTLRGDAGGEVWTPRFSYYGFRYVEAEVSSSDVKVASVGGEFLHAAVPVVGRFAYRGSRTGDLFERIHGLIDRAILSNMVSVLTDCPHREKLGWLEQTHLAAASIMANYDVSGLYRKMEDDMADAQLPDGSEYAGLVPSIAPEYVAFNDAAGKPNAFRDSPEWGSAVILSPWAAYQAYGEVAPLRAHYESMQRYAAYLGRRAKGHLLDYGLGDWYDIGPGEPGPSKLTEAGLTPSAIYFEDLTALARIAGLLGKTEDAARYTAEAEAVKAAFQARFFHPETDTYSRGSQTAQATPLALGMVPKERRAAVLAKLAAGIEGNGYRVTAGDIGFHYVVRALTDGGRSDVLYRMIALTTNPSYGYQLAQGATTLTEAWDANPRSSQNHFMLGHAEEWFYRGLAGIDVDMSRAAGERIRVHPFVPALELEPSAGASASVRTPLGAVAVHWKRDGGRLVLEVTAPGEAVLTVPGGWRFAGMGRMRGVSALGGKTFGLKAGVYRFYGSAGE